MANQEHVDLIKTDLASFKQWCLDNKDIKLDLSGANLNDADLSRANLNGADLSRANLNYADLSGADLNGADLSYAHLSRANLNGADLSRADLSGADLSGADLRNADLSGADLSRANLNYADLSDADLSEADLHYAELNYAELNYAELYDVRLYNTVFVNIDLTDVVGLDACSHDGPSIIDHRTLEMSGRLPDIFLRGCGLSDWQIESSKLFQPSLSSQEINDIGYKIIQLKTDNPISFYSCFISYSHADKAFARRLHDQLQGKGIRCWLDEHEMLPGDDIYEKVDHGIKLWDKVLLCASENSLTSWWVDNEIDSAFEKERRLMKERKAKVLSLIPLNLDDYMFSGQWDSKGKEPQIKSRLAADFIGWENDSNKFQQAFDKVVKALQADDSGRNPPPKPKL